MTVRISAREVWIALLLLWLAGNALRLTILAVPPVIPLIHDDLHMSATQVGILTGLPSLLLALAAVPGSLLIARTGVLAALTIGLLLNAAGGALRGAANDVLWLYAMTIVMGAGVAIMQVAMPPAVRCRRAITRAARSRPRVRKFGQSWTPRPKAAGTAVRQACRG